MPAARGYYRIDRVYKGVAPPSALTPAERTDLLLNVLPFVALPSRVRVTMATRVAT
jgi:hypothetical protein